MNPIELIKSYMTRGLSLKGIATSMIGNDPMLNNLANMIDKGDNKGAESFVRSMLNQRGLDYDKEMANMKQRLNIN
jgi:hypothetical protein